MACCFAKLVGHENRSHHCHEQDLALSSGSVSRRQRGGGGGARKGRGRGSVGSSGWGRSKHASRQTGLSGVEKRLAAVCVSAVAVS